MSERDRLKAKDEPERLDWPTAFVVVAALAILMGSACFVVWVFWA